MQPDVMGVPNGARGTKIRQEVAIYCRVSTDEQRDRQTIENQVELAARHCESKGMTVFDFYRDDGVTGTIPLAERPEGKRLVEDARLGR